MVILSHFQARQLIEARARGASTARISLDLNLTESDVSLQAESVLFAAGESLDWKRMEEISANETLCYRLEKSQLRPIKAFSEFSGRVYGLMPTASAPTMLISGIPMHRIKDTNPHQDTLSKLKAIAPVKGRQTRDDH
jgi:predicted methyltransferase